MLAPVHQFNLQSAIYNLVLVLVLVLVQSAICTMCTPHSDVFTNQCVLRNVKYRVCIVECTDNLSVISTALQIAVHRMLAQEDSMLRAQQS